MWLVVVCLGSFCVFSKDLKGISFWCNSQCIQFPETGEDVVHHNGNRAIPSYHELL